MVILSAGAQHFKMIALCDVSDSHGPEVAGSSTPSLGGLGRQNVFVLEGENLLNTNSLTTAPVQLELRQVITIKQHDLSGPATHRPDKHPSALVPHSQSGGRNASIASVTAVPTEPVSAEAPRIEALMATTRGFMITGGNGFVALFERALDKRESFIEVRRLFLGDLNIIGTKNPFALCLT